MLGKLLKYELKATGRTFLPFYGAIFVLSFVTKFFSSIQNTTGNMEVPTAISGIIYGFLIMAVWVLTFVIALQRFYKNLLGDEGYLMFTLPVSTHSNIIAKLLSTLLWTVLSGITSFLSVIVLAWDGDFFAMMGRSWNVFLEAFNHPELAGHQGSVIVCFILTILICLMFLISFIVKIYASMSVGHLGNKHRGLLSFAAFIGFGIVEQIVFSIFSGLNLFREFFRSFGYYTYTENTGLYFQNIILTLIIFLVGLIIYNAIYYLVTYFILNRKLNLE